MLGRTTLILAAIVCLAPAGSGIASAATSMPKCATNDSVVLYDAKTKSYTPMTKTPSANGMMAPNTVAMCKSQATKMGAKVSSMAPTPQKTGPMNGTNGSFNGPSPEPTETGATPAPGPPSHTP
jgi:hypothetical protein